MNAPLTYLPAYIGLFASLMLAVACNAFLDIQYGSFGFEMFFWTLVFGWTLLVGWKQRGQANESGPQQQKAVLLLGLVAAVVIFIPMWGFPRAGLYMLVVLQASLNCVTTTQRQLHFGLLVSAVMVMFAAAHYRADWTMLFYLIPYIIAVVFTLVSEQISRRAQDVRQTSLGNAGHAGQGLAIAAATAIILGLGGLLYLATPQLTWLGLEWRYGQLTNIGFLGEPQEKGKAGQSGGGTEGSGQGGNGQNSEGGPGNGNGQGSDSGGSGNPGRGNNGNSGSGSGGGSAGDSGEGYELSPGRGWPSPAEMRKAAKRPGMPEWQSGAIMQMASLDEAIGEALAPVKAALEDLWNRLKEWLKENRTAAMASLFAALLLALLIVAGLLLREIKTVAWLRTRFDYLRLVTLARHANGTAGATQFYRAMERLFVIAETPRAANANTREFLREATYYRDHIRPEATELTRLFEQYRYGPEQPDHTRLGRMRDLYRAIFHKLG